MSASLPSASAGGRASASLLWRYGLAVAATLVALLVKLALGPVIVPSVFITFYAAVLVSARFGGVGPGIVSLILAEVLSAAFLLPSPMSAEGTAQMTLFRTVLFAGIAGAVIWVTKIVAESRRRVARALELSNDELERRVQARTTELSDANRQLQDAIDRREQAEARLRNAFEFAPIGLAIGGLEGYLTQVNTALCHMLGYTAEELLSKPVWEVMHPDDVPAAQADWARLLAGTARSYAAERRYMHKAGHVVWGETGISLVRDREGRPLQSVGHVRDITERRLAERVLRESESKFRTLAETVPVASFIFQGAALRYVNRAATAITGYSSSELLGMQFWDIIHPEHRELVRQRGLARQRGESVPAQYEVMVVTKSGETRWVDFSAGTIEFEGSSAVLGTAFDVTERKRAEEVIRRSEQSLRDQASWLQSILNSLGEAVVVADKSGKLLYFNPVAERLHGRGPADIALADWSREYGVYLPDGTLAPSEQLPIARAMRGATRIVDEEFAVRPHGQDVFIPVIVTATPVVSEDGSLQGSVVVYRDISNVKQAEARLRRSEERLNEAERLAHVGAWEWVVATNEVIWSDEQFRIFGLEPRGPMVEHGAFLDRIVPEDRPRVEDAVAAALAGTRPFELECGIRRPQGEIRDVYVRGEVTRDATGRALRMGGTLVDITDRKRSEAELERRVIERTAELLEEVQQRQDTEAALRDSEQRFRAAFEQAAVGVSVVGPDQSWIMVNDRLCEILGYSREELVQLTFRDVTYAEDLEADETLLRKVFANEIQTFAIEKRYVRKDGSLIWATLTGSVVRDAAGAPRYGIVVIQDISARKQAESERLAAEERLQRVLEEITDGFYTLDEAGRFTYLNPSAARFFDRPASELLGKNVWEAFPEAISSPFYDGYQRLLRERVAVQIEAYYPPRNRWFRVHAYPVQQGISVLQEDVTESHHTEATTLSDILRALNGALDVGAAFPQIATGLRTLTRCDRSTLTFFDHDYESATVVAVSEPRVDVQSGTRLSMRDIPATRNVLAGRPHVVPNLAVELESPIVQRIVADGFRSVLCLPLRGTEQVLGMLTLTWRQLAGGNVGQLPLLTQIADAVALATEKSHLFEEVRSGRERLEALSHRLIEVQELERQHIARELHDEVGQALTALQLSLEAIASLPEEGAAARLREARRQVNELLARVRNLALDLRPAMLDDLGLLPAFLWLFERFAAQAGMQVTFEHRGLERRFNPEIETAAYRIVQEALTNVARHARVSVATVRAWSDQSMLSVQIVDQGEGFDPVATSAVGVSSGLAGMRERAMLLGGRLTVESERGKGARVSAELPLAEGVGETGLCQ